MGSPSITPAGAGRWQKTIGALGLIVVLWVGDRLYDVISAGSSGNGGGHQPGGQAPTTEHEPTAPTSDGTTGSGGHDPSQFDHG